MSHVTHMLKKNIIRGLLLCIIIFSSQAHAEVVRTQLNVDDTNDFVVEPGKTEIYLNPGESIKKSVSITNRQNKKVSYSIKIEDFVGTEDPNNPIKLLGEEAGPYSLKNLVVPELAEFTLNFGERIVIPIEVNIPVTAEPRGYYGAIVVSNQPEIDDQVSGNSGAEGKTRLISRIGSLLLVRVNGLGEESGKLEDLKLLGPSKLFYEKKPAGFEILFRNDGNVHLVPSGKISITNIIGKKVAELPVDAYFALPDSLRYREIQWQEGFGFGRYKANLSLYRGYGNQFDEDSVVFWVLPWKLLLAIFVIICFIYYISRKFEFKRK
ncbi:MAG: hypothetical protein V4686_00085 [Patescibacteria group bacterium]